MRFLMAAVFSMILCSSAFAQIDVILGAGTAFDTGTLYVSSGAIRQHGSTSPVVSTWSTTRSALDSDESFDTSRNIHWTISNARKEYDVMVDSCIWTNKGSETLLGVDTPWIMFKGRGLNLEAKNSAKVHMRILSELRGWTTLYYIRSYKE